jgi:uncharacterized protein involved in outer membrane biogenesis
MKKKYIVLIIVAILVAGLAIASVIAVKTASRLLEEKRKNLLGLDLELKSYYIDWARARIVLEGVALYPTGKVVEKEKLASVEKLIIAISPRDIFKENELHITKVVFDKPEVSYIRLTRKTKNWDALDLSQLGSEEKKEEGKPTGEEFRVRIDDLTIRDGTVNYRNLADGGRLDLKDLEVKVEDIVYEPDISKLPTDIEMTARIDDTSGKFSLKGEANLLAKGINFKAHANLSPMPVTYFAPFYAGDVPFPITSGTISVVSNAKAVDSQLTSGHNISISGLRVGGGVKGDLINKFILSQNDRIVVSAAVNGNLETGDVSISHTASKAIVDQLMAGAMKQTPVGVVGETIKGGGKTIEGGGKKIGDKVKGLFGH